MNTDVDFLLEVLSDGQEHELAEILQRSIDERGCGLTTHSRAADLRKRGYKVKNEVKRKGDGRSLSYYRLVGLKETSGADAAAAASAATDVSLSPAVDVAVVSEEEQEWEFLRTLEFPVPLTDAEGFAESGGDQLGLLGGDPHAAPGAYSVEAA